MKNFLSRLTKRKRMFALSVAVASYVLMMWLSYSSENSIACNFHYSFSDKQEYSVFDRVEVFRVLNCAGFPYFKMLFATFLVVFVPYLFVGLYFFDYRNECNEGWKRLYLTTQILIPIFLIIVFYESAPIPTILNSFIITFGVGEIVALILIKSFLWFKEGFTRKQI